jgi:type IV secretory pathway VirB10-like protein
LSGLSTAVGTSALGSQGQPTIVIGGVTTEAGNATARTVEHLLNRLPTVEIGEGHRVHVFLTRDLHLPSFAEGSETPRIGTGTEER